MNQLIAKKHYPTNIQKLIQLYNQNKLTNVDSIDIEPVFGYVARINYKNNNSRVIYGYDYGHNSLSANKIAKDKTYTKFLLQKNNINCPKGMNFILPSWQSKLEHKIDHNILKQKDITNLQNYVDNNLKYPIYLKPNNGSKGHDVYKIYSNNQLTEAIQSYIKKNIEIGLVEETINFPDYRIVVFNGKFISAYKRNPPLVIGDGKSNIRKLISLLDSSIDHDDERIRYEFKSRNLNFDSILGLGEKISILPVSNLSAGGTVDDVSEIINERWVNLALNISNQLNLKLCGIDLACKDIKSDKSDYSVLEVNSMPGFNYFAKTGPTQKKIIDNLYIEIFNNN